MVAPTRTPQARGVKCDLCKKILASATWLDQNNLAKSTEEAKKVLKLIDKHEASGCMCIPRNIQNLLVGSTHFEVHRLSIRKQDSQIHSKQIQTYRNTKPLVKKESMNDCIDHQHVTRFRVSDPHPTEEDSFHHLKKAIDFWKFAMEDQTNPFNSKLGLRLGLTHHVIYACYFFKFYKILDYQLVTANLLVNLFESIDSVTANAKLHASYILVKSFIDCDLIQLAKTHVKQAVKQENFKDKTSYESILLSCVFCELKLMDGENTLDDLVELASIQPGDKLQHYFARTMALSTIIKYIHCFPARSNHCFEFFHTYRYMCAIIRRCYESSFQLVLYDKDMNEKPFKNIESNQNQILDHGWIKPAVCDFVFSSFDLLSRFYMRAGMPEALELAFNGLELISCRTVNHYWQAKLASIGSSLDILCDKLTHSKIKLDAIKKISESAQDQYIKDIIRLNLKVSSLEHPESGPIKSESIDGIVQDVYINQLSLKKRLSVVVFYDLIHQSSEKISDHLTSDKKKQSSGNNFTREILTCYKLGIVSLLNTGDTVNAKLIARSLKKYLSEAETRLLDYNNYHDVLEILLRFAQCDPSADLLKSIKGSDVFLKANDELANLHFRMSGLTLESATSNVFTDATSRRSNRREKKLSIRKSQKNYEVAGDSTAPEPLDVLDELSFLTTGGVEKLIICYMRNSEPNPDYLLYRLAHEMIFSIRLKDYSDKSCKEMERSQLLYHFVESCSATTMRYRWMMFDEQQVRPFEPFEHHPKENRQASSKLLGFNTGLFNSITKKRIPENYQLVQMKYILDSSSKEEHLLIASIDKEGDPIFVDCEKTTDFLENVQVKEENFHTLTLPNRFTMKVEEAKKTLFFKNSTIRTDARQKLEAEIQLLLYDLERSWLGPFRILLIGKIIDDDYDRFVEQAMNDIEGYIDHSHRINYRLFKIIIENAPLLSREEFCHLLGTIFACDSSSNVVRGSFDKWTKSLESYLSNKDSKLDKKTYFHKLVRSQVGLILDKSLEHIPFESMPTSQDLKQGIFRVPSLRLFHIIASRYGSGIVKIESHKTVYILDPLSNLAKTRKMFEVKLRSQQSWEGVVGQPPKSEDLEDWLGKKKVYLFIGHGAGTLYYNRLCKGRGLAAMTHIEATPLVMGCSSGKVSSEGPKLESFGINWVFIFRGSPAYTGLLWDVTDTDIDKFFESLLSKWMHEWNQSDRKGSSGDAHSKVIAITDAIAQSRQVCNYKFLVGATPVVYGLPVCCEFKS